MSERQDKRPADEELAILLAKELLMYDCGMTEQQAHKYLQKEAMDKCVTKYEIAKRILSGHGK
ncbi:MAG: ANTAR domain-containing protein [Ruminococcus sp.]|nr:ANTAR domain-containing protein [Ruminococcus sp.]